MTAATEADDRLAIMELVSRYFAAIDDKRLTDPVIVDATFTPDGRIVSPNGTALVGRDAIFAARARALTASGRPLMPPPTA
jgi:hypothetical protein